jgi:hypothetical protein
MAKAKSLIEFGFCGGGILMMDPALANGLHQAVAAGIKAGLQMAPDGKKRVRIDIMPVQGKDLLPTLTLVKESGQEKFLLTVDSVAKGGPGPKKRAKKSVKKNA